MIECDRELLVRLCRANRHLGAVVVELLHRQDGGELPSAGLRALADGFGVLSADLRARAAEIDGHSARNGSGGPMLNARHWEALEAVLAEMCERSRGSLEDLHDRGRGVLETCRPASHPGSPIPGGDADLRQHIHQVIGALAHLTDAAADDRRAVRATGRDVARLARHMLTHTPGPRLAGHPPFEDRGLA